MEMEVQERLKAQSKTFTSDGIRKRLNHWTKYVQTRGNCVGKQNTGNYYVITLLKVQRNFL
jgi:hypothetical protein